jgi:putative transposase
MDIDVKRINSLAKYRLGWKVTDICRSEDISRMTFYRWLKLYERQGQRGLVKKSTRPKTIHYKITDDIIEKIIRLRKETGSNEHAIRSFLFQRGIAVGHRTIYEVLKENGLINSLSEARKQRTYIRYEREHPNSLWQGDLTNWNEQVVVAYIDDHSRFVTGYGMFDNGLTVHVMDVLSKAIRSYGKPRQLITDHGTQFYNVHGGESEFDKFCAENQIEHILGSIGKPTTTGKIERWFGTFKAQIDSFRSVDDYVRYYNYERPHKSLGYATPAERYFRKV